jgi:site-specific DNA recombinase
VARVSTLDQEQDGTSLDDQLEKGRLLAQMHDLTVVDDGQYVGDESGCLPLAQRPIIQRLLADARAQRFDAVCFHKIDRMGRSARYIFELWAALEDLGITIHIIDPAIDSSHPFGRLMRTILAAFAEFERDMIVSRTDGARRRNIADGQQYLPAGKYGYKYRPINREKGTKGQILRNEDQVPIVERMFRRRAQRASYERIALELTADGVRSPKGQARWSWATVRKIIIDPAYCGKGKWGRNQTVRSARGKRTLRPRRDGHPGLDVAYPPIVTEEEWRAANAAPDAAVRCPMRAGPDRFLLGGGMVRCAEHDLGMSGSGSGGDCTQYRCVRRLPDGRRAQHSVSGRALDRAVWAAVTGFLLAPERGLAAAQREALDAEADLEELAQQRLALATRLAEIAREGQWVLNEGYRLGASAEMIEGRMKELRAEEASLHAQEAQVAARMDLARERMPRAEQIKHLLEEYHKGAQCEDPHERRALLEDLEVWVEMRGHDYVVRGCVKDLEEHGRLQVHGMPASR